MRYRLTGGERASLDLPPAVDAALGWALREGITNVLRHSAATECTLRLSRDGREVALELVNDGVTPDPARSDAEGIELGLALPNGNGLRGLSERARALGGAIEVGPLNGARFRVCVRIPLAQVVAERAAEAMSAGIATAKPEQTSHGPTPAIDPQELLEQVEGIAMIRVMLAEDQAMVRGALAALLALEGDIEIVAKVGRGDEGGFRGQLQMRPDVALLDIEMPGCDGLAAAAALRQQLPACRCSS